MPILCDTYPTGRAADSVCITFLQKFGIVVFNLSDEDRPQALEVSGVNGTLFCDSRPPNRGRGYGGPSRGGRRPNRTHSAPDGDGGDDEGGNWSTVSRN